VAWVLYTDTGGVQSTICSCIFYILNKSSRSCKACSPRCRQGMPWQWCSSRSPMSWSGEASCHGLHGQVKLTPRSGSGRSQVRVSLMILATLDMGMGVRAPVVYVLLIWPTSLCAETEICPRFGYFFFFPSSGVRTTHHRLLLYLLLLLVAGRKSC
jgi:hypothetical protein